MTASPAVVSRTLDFADNRSCAALFGSHHEHLARIEQKLQVSLIARGNQVTACGEPEAVDAAATVLEDLYQRVEGGVELARAEIDGVVRLVTGGGESGSGRYLGEDLLLRTERRRVLPRSPNQAAYLRAMRAQDLVFGIGPAGTGKTYLAVAQGVAMLKQRQVERLILSRPAVEAGERLGFLPGDMKDKVDPYLRPLYDALQDMLGEGKLAPRLESGQVEVAPLAFMRGRTLANAFIILDESQNTTPAQMKMFLTRMGENSRMVVTGDPTQHDLPPGTPSGLADALGRLEQVAEVGIVRFTNRDIVRHPLVEAILRAYDGAESDAT
jgi:phosphate starvation-inducible PhoH-like protein